MPRLAKLAARWPARRRWRSCSSSSAACRWPGSPPRCAGPSHSGSRWHSPCTSPSTRPRRCSGGPRSSGPWRAPARQLLEKVVEAASLCLLSGVAAAAAGMPPIFRIPVWSVALLGAALVALVALLPLVRSTPPVWPRSLLWSCASDLADAAVLGLCLQAAGVHLGPVAWLVVLLAINLAILLPSTPGHLGVVEAAAGTSLIALGVPAERALAGAILYHAVQIVPSTVLGLAVLRKRWIRQRSPA